MLHSPPSHRWIIALHIRLFNFIDYITFLPDEKHNLIQWLSDMSSFQVPFIMPTSFFFAFELSMCGSSWIVIRWNSFRLWKIHYITLYWNWFIKYRIGYKWKIRRDASPAQINAYIHISTQVSTSNIDGEIIWYADDYSTSHFDENISTNTKQKVINSILH